MRPRLRDEEMRAWQALLHVHFSVTRALDAELQSAHGISLEGYDVLLRLARAPDHSLRMAQLAGRVLIPPSTLTRRVDRLVSDGLVERARMSRDSRVVIARLTDPGLKLVRRAALTHLHGIREHFTGRLTDDALEAVADGLEQIVGPHEPH